MSASTYILIKIDLQPISQLYTESAVLSPIGAPNR